MDEYLFELQDLDETQERVEAVSEEMLKAAASEDTELVSTMVDKWIEALRASDFQSERIAYLYVANHVLQTTTLGKDVEKTSKRAVFLSLFRNYLEEAVSLISNSPIDRQHVQRLLELWHDSAIYPDEDLLRFWKCTGEDLPLFLAYLADANDVADSKSRVSKEQGVDPAAEDIEAELEQVPPPELPKLDGHAANPVLDVLKRMDRHKAAILFLEQKLQENHQFMLNQAPNQYFTEQDILNDYSVTPATLKSRAEECLQLVKTKNMLLAEIPQLKEQLKVAIATMIANEEEAAQKNDQRLEQCDEIDIGLADLAEHREAYSDEWSKEAFACIQRRRRRDEEERQREAEMTRLHHAAVAESNAHAKNLEADMTSDATAEQKALAKGGEEEREEKKSENEMVWHPVLKELVPLQSLNLEWESWRDH